MKKLLLSLVGVCLFFSCDNDGMDNTNLLIGTWENATDTQIETLTFSENNKLTSTYKFLIIPDFEPITENGTYQYYDTVIIFRFEYGKFFADYSISDNELTLSFSHTGNTGIYIKK